MTTNAERCRAYYAKNREKLLVDARKKRAADPEEARKRSREKYAANRERNIEAARKYRREKRDEVNARAMAKYRTNRAVINDRRKGYRAKHYDKIYARIQEWRKRNPEKEFRHHAKRLINEQTGIPIREIPDDLVDAKMEQLKITRWVRDQLAGLARNENSL